MFERTQHLFESNHSKSYYNGRMNKFTNGLTGTNDQSYKLKEKKRNRQTDRWMDRRTDKRTKRQTYGWTDIQTYRWTDRQTYGRTDGRTKKTDKQSMKDSGSSLM